MASKQHGLTSMNATRPKKKVRDRKNKAAARKRKEALLQALEEAIAVARGEHTHKSPKKAAPKKETAKKTPAKKPAAKKETKKVEPKATKATEKKTAKKEE